MNTPLTRVFEAACCHTQIALADILGIRQSSISDAKKRNRIPADWLVTLLRVRGVNPEWILTGKEPKYLIVPDEQRMHRKRGTDDASLSSGSGQVHRGFLQNFSSRELAEELVRRAEGSS